MVFEPPRHAKSELVTISSPPVVLARNPNQRFMLACHTAQLAHQFGRKARELFRAHVPHLDIDPERFAVADWYIKGHKGGMASTGVGGPMTGGGAHWLLIDDPIKEADEAKSATQRQKQVEWWQQVARTRLEPDARIIVIMTRWNEADLAGYILNNEGGEDWTIVNLPAVAEENDQLGRDPGEALWPERHPIEELMTTKRDVGEYAWSAMFQQRPAPLEGNLLKVERIKKVSRVPDGIYWTRYWDIAASTSRRADYTASVRVGTDYNGVTYITRGIRGKWEWPDSRKVIINTAKAEQSDTQVIIETNGIGMPAFDELKRMPEMMQVALRAHTKRRSKSATVEAPNLIAVRIEAGMVAIEANGSWADDFMEELRVYDNGEHDDYVDSVAEGYIYSTRPNRRYDLGWTGEGTDY